MPFFFVESRRPALRGLLLSVVLGAAVAGCREDRDPVPPPDPSVAGREYSPVVVGQWREYAVTDHRWQANVDSVKRYLVRERVDTVFTGATGEINYRVVRARRPDSLQVWRDDSTYALILNANELHRTYANRPVLELLFPMREGKSWNPNLYNAADSSSRAYLNLGQPFTQPNGRRFERAVRVLDQPDVSLIRRRELEQVYAWGIGPVYRHRVVIDFCNGDPDCQLGTGYIVRGLEREEQLIKFGGRP